MVKFIKEANPDNKFDNTYVEIRVLNPEATITDLAEAFKEFLMACGYPVKYNEEIQIVGEEE